MKRSLVFWPLSSSILVIAVCWLAAQEDRASNYLVAQSLDWLKSSRFPASDTGDQVLNRSGQAISAAVVVNQTDGLATTDIDKPRASSSSADISAPGPWFELSEMQTWDDASFEVQQPTVAGIPAPSLDSHSDLFGFGPKLNEDQVPVLELVTPDEQAVAVSLDGPRRSAGDGIVIKIDSELFFADDRPLAQESGRDYLDAGSPRMAERPTGDVALPPVYEAPAASVADLSPRNESTESVPSADEMKLIDPVLDLSDRLSGARQYDDESDLDEQPEVPSASRRESTLSELSNDARHLAQARSATWPVANRLIEQLDILDVIAHRITNEVERVSADDSSLTPSLNESGSVSATEILQWSAEVRKILGQLPQSNRLGDATVRLLLDQLNRSQQFASEHAENIPSRSLRVAWLQAAYSVERRLSVWEPVYQINSGNFPVSQHVGDDVLPAADAIDRLQVRISETGDADGWNKFLVLDRLRDAFESGDDQSRREIAQKFLSRLNWPNLEPAHKAFLAEDSLRDVADAIRPWASGAIDYSALLHQIEKAESNAIDLVTAEVAQSMQALGHATHPQAQQLAANINTHYRNANVRFSISDQLLASLLPEIPTKEVPVRTTLLGSRVTGVSRVSSDLQIRLKPSPSTWELELETIGNVSTRSVGRRGPAAVSTSSINPFSASTPISIKPSDIQLGNADVNVGGRSRLRGINTSYDSWPLVGTLVQNFAESEYFEKASLANRIGRNRIRNQIGDEIDRTVNEKVEVASDKFSKTILGPLTDLRLDPQVIDMSSTSSRLIARYRMAGDWQLAAMTPRPRALADNLFSVQIHQSAINNALEQLVPQDDAMPIADVLRQCYDVLGATEAALPEDLPEDTLIHFAKHRPITIEIADGKVWITMRIIRLQRDKSLLLRNFIVRASYVPEVSGLNASLVREGHLSISGPGMSMRQRLPVRAIFNKVLSPNRPLPLTSPELLAERMPEQTGITQFELRDGWIGISLGKITDNQRIAKRPDGVK
ncbi:MAG: hypothetical protein KDB00_25305 [Planctomycetales bacterium]|nr:hypothetical protein [Planctomycetales bacterium]